jgi:hypothetical protein
MASIITDSKQHNPSSAACCSASYEIDPSYETKGSLPCSQKLITRPYSEQDKLSAHLNPIFLNKFK